MNSADNHDNLNLQLAHFDGRPMFREALGEPSIEVIQLAQSVVPIDKENPPPPSERFNIGGELYTEIRIDTPMHLFRSGRFPFPEVAVPKDYDDDLREVMLLHAASNRAIAWQKGAEPLLQERYEAREKLKQHPLSKSLALEQLVPILGHLPSNALVKRITILPWNCPTDWVYAKEHQKSDWITAVESNEQGDVFLFKPEPDDRTSATLKCERHLPG